MPVLSTVIPFKNVREYIEESLESIISQSLEDREIILVDDGSTDGSGDYAKELTKRYDWVYYVQTDGLGPGGARNAGIRVAKGKYINFADADDIVPPETYERMFEEAERYEADVVVGKAVRLDENTGEIKRSSLHEKVYFEYHHLTNIREYPNLIYDTTVWNKLIRRDLWQDNKITFPEKTPYQDIPATFMMHCCSDRVVMMDEVVYIWRIRGGSNRSITQQKTNFDNLRARLNMIRLVDDWCAGHEIADNILTAKQIKWLSIDLKSFMNESVDMDEEDILELMNIIKGYYDGSGLQSVMPKMPVLIAEQYKALSDGDPDKLRRVRRFEKEGLKNIKADYRKGILTGQFPDDIVKGQYTQIETTVNMEQLIQGITKISCDADGYAFYGYAFIRHQPARTRFAIKYKAYLIKSNGECLKELRIKRHGSKVAEGKGKGPDGETLTNYYGAGFTVFVDKATLASLEEGRYHIRLVWESHGRKRDTILRGLTKKQIDSLNDTSVRLEGNKESIVRSTLLKEPEIHVTA